jgi:hypothetical protein
MRAASEMLISSLSSDGETSGGIGVKVPVGGVERDYRTRCSHRYDQMWMMIPLAAGLVITLTWPASLVVAYALANGPLRSREGSFGGWRSSSFPARSAFCVALGAHRSAGAS